MYVLFLCIFILIHFFLFALHYTGVTNVTFYDPLISNIFIYFCCACLTFVCLLAFYYCNIMPFICLRSVILSQYLCAIVGHVQPVGALLSFIYKKLRLLCSYIIGDSCNYFVTLKSVDNLARKCYSIATRSRRTADRQDVNSLDCNSLADGT